MDIIQNQLVPSFRRAAGLLRKSQAVLKAEVVEFCDRLENPTCRIAVFGPFNYGKSTLLNALLGEKTLPMDLVPTTGAAITVKYGDDSRTCVIRKDGSVQEAAGTGILEQVAVLDEQRKMQADVAAVEVYCSHPLLKLGLELVDLPGTDDTQAQNDLVQQELLSADLVIQVLDGRKLMTLAERENLRDWLLDRGIETVIFVVNFLNLMEVDDRQQVAARLRFLAESFRAQLPDGVSNLYQVDALPALRARLKGATAAATQSGLVALESALQTVGQQVEKGSDLAQVAPRIRVLATELSTALQQQVEELSEPQDNPEETARTAIKERARSLIQQGFSQDLEKLRAWLAPNSLQANYRLGLAQALETGKTQSWLRENLQPAWNSRQSSVVVWVHQACDFFDSAPPKDLFMAFADTPEPQVEMSAQQENKETASTQSGVAPVAIATGLGWILGGPFGAAVLAGTAHLVGQSGRKEQAALAKDETVAAIDFEQQADVYLQRFSEEALSAITHYERVASEILSAELPTPKTDPTAAQTAKINLLKTTLEDLEEICSLLSVS